MAGLQPTFLHQARSTGPHFGKQQKFRCNLRNDQQIPHAEQFWFPY